MDFGESGIFSGDINVDSITKHRITARCARISSLISTGISLACDRLISGDSKLPACTFSTAVVCASLALILVKVMIYRDSRRMALAWRLETIEGVL